MKKLFGKNKRHRPRMHKIISDIAFTRFDIVNSEGNISYHTPLKIYKIFISIIIFIFIVFIIKIVYLQIIQGEYYKLAAENNSFVRDIVFPNRGLIYDRNNVLLVSNEAVESNPYKRNYKIGGFGQLLGFVTYPQKDINGKYFRSSISGVVGLESLYDDILKGSNGLIAKQKDATQKEVSSYIIRHSVDGIDVNLSIDSRIQTKAYEILKNNVNEFSFVGGAGVMMDIEKGEIIFSVSYPDFDSNKINKENTDLVNKYLDDDRKVFLNRAISGLYTPGSSVKPIFALAALEENIISQYKKIESTGALVVENIYSKKNPFIFRDNKIHGFVNISEAIAKSSNEYFYHIGGGSKIQRGLGIDQMNRYANLFGLGKSTKVSIYAEPKGVIPNPKWKKEVFSDNWRIGDTYNTVIGQYGFQVTPMQMLRAYGLLARKDSLIEPHFEKNKIGFIAKRNFSESNMDIVAKGMRLAVLDGTVKILNVPYTQFAAKSGSAQVGSLGFINSLIGGFFPYKNPKYAFFFVMERGNSKGYPAGSFARQLFDWMANNTPEYFL